MQAIRTEPAAASDVKILLDVDDLPRAWYNILPDLPAPFPPYLHPGTKEPVPPQAFEPLFPKELIRQEMSPNRAEPIPDELREAYFRLGRPTPLYRAKRLEAFLKTPARIYYKREDLSPVGSHKPNTAFAQAYFAAQEGVEALATETGAGQWGSALALATNYFGLKAKVFMVRVSYDQKPYRKYVMNLYGADVIPSPSDQTNVGRKFLAQDPDHPGSLGIAISEAIESAVTGKNTKYSLGSVLNHVLMHQTIIGLEAQKQFELADVTPDFMVGSVGGGSNFAGFTYPMIGERIHGHVDTRFVAVEPESVPSMTQGRYEYDFGDTGEMTPLVKMHTLGHTFVPPRIHAGGLRYHGTAAARSKACGITAIRRRGRRGGRRRDLHRLRRISRPRGRVAKAAEHARSIRGGPRGDAGPCRGGDGARNHRGDERDLGAEGRPHRVRDDGGLRAPVAHRSSESAIPLRPPDHAAASAGSERTVLRPAGARGRARPGPSLPDETRPRGGRPARSIERGRVRRDLAPLLVPRSGA